MDRFEFVLNVFRPFPNAVFVENVYIEYVM